MSKNGELLGSVGQKISQSRNVSTPSPTSHTQPVKSKQQAREEFDILNKELKAKYGKKVTIDKLTPQEYAKYRELTSLLY